MAKLAPLLILFSVHFAEAKRLTLEFLGEKSLSAKTRLAGEPVGGLSGLIWDGARLYAVSDDRGKHGKPRFYEMEFKIKSGVPEFTPLKAIHLSGVDSKWALDLESLVVLPNGDFVFSSEGDNNAKPRAWPRLFATTAQGHYQYEISIPDKFLPNLLGRQKKGIQNNRGFEGLAASSDGQDLFMINEAPILDDLPKGGGDSQWLRLIQYKKQGQNFKVHGEYPYLLDVRSRAERGTEVFRGVTELLYLSGDRFLSLERGVRVGSSGISYSGALYVVDLSGAKDVSTVASLSEGNTASVKKEKLVDLENIKKIVKTENYEGLAWGPLLPNGHRSLLVLSDDNFSSREKTQILVFELKEVE